MSNNFGYAHFQPDDVASDLNAMAYIARQVLAQVDTMKIVKVIGVHPGSGSPPAVGTVDVQPLVNQIDGEGFGVAHGIVYGLPFMRWQAGGWAIVADPVVGDTGLLICADRDISNVVKNNAQANPGSRRRHNMSDGIYLGAILGAAPTSYFQANSDGTWKLADKAGNVIVSATSGISLTPAGGTLTVNGTISVTGGVNVTGNIAATGTITAGVGGADSVTLQLHTHTANNTPPTAGT